jgi:hypothetical protein
MSESPETDLVRELRALAGASEDSRTFAVECGGHEIRIEYCSGSTSSLWLSASYDAAARDDHPALVEGDARAGYRSSARRPLVATRPLAIKLCPERADDVTAKLDGATVEWQSGDPAFDDAVYVATPTTDTKVLTGVLGPEVRAAVLDLLALGFMSVTLDGDEQHRVGTYLIEFVRRGPEQPDRGAQAIRAFAQLLSNLPALTTATEGHAPVPLAGWTRLLGAIGVIGWALNGGFVVGLVALLQHLFGVRDPEGASATMIVIALVGGVTAGLLAGKAYGDEVRRRVWGTSLAQTHISTARACAFGGMSVLVFTLVLIAATWWQTR